MTSTATSSDLVDMPGEDAVHMGKGGKREIVFDFLSVALACTIFLSLALYQLDLPGLYTDEAYDVIPAMQMVLGQRVELQGEVLDLGGLRLPLMSSSAYQGVTYTYLSLPFFVIGGVNVYSLRLMTALVGMLGVVLAYFLGKAWFGRGVGRLAALLLAFSPAWVFWSRLGVYVVSVVVPIATGALLAFTSWLRSPKRSHKGLYLGLFLLGLGLTTKLLFLWFISALAITALILWGRTLWGQLRPGKAITFARLRVALLGFAFFCLGALPFLLYNVLTKGTLNLIRQTLTGPSTTSYGVDNTAIVRNLWTAVDSFKVLLDGGYFWFQGVNQQPHANPTSPPIFAIAAVGLIALVLRRRWTSSGKPPTLQRDLAIPVIVLVAALAAASLQAMAGLVGPSGALLTGVALLLGVAGVALLALRMVRDGSNLALACALLLAFAAMAGAIWWFGGGMRPEGRSPDGPLGLWPIDPAGILFWLWGAALLVILGSDSRPATHQRAVVATLALIGLLVAQSTVTVSGLWSTHLLIALPLPQIVIAAFAVELTRFTREKLAARRQGKARAMLSAVPAGLLIATLAIGDATVDAIYHSDLAKTGGASTFSDAIYSLDRYLQTEKAGYQVVAMDWGLRRPLQFLSNGRIVPIEGYGLSEEPPPEFYTSLREFMQEERTVYLFHNDQGTAYPRREAFLAEVAAAGKEAVQDATFKHRDGIPVYELYTVR